jgi:hypothetical protein
MMWPTGRKETTDMNTIEIAGRATGSEADRYRAILEGRIGAGARSAASLIERIHTEAPKDQIVSTRAAKFFPIMSQHRVGVEFGDEVHTISDHALGQVSERAGVPTAYLRELSDGKAWKADLACTILNVSYANVDRQRVLARSVRGQVRGWLSDKYRRLDSRPLVDALAKECQALGAVPVDGTATETRVALKVLMPDIIEPVPGEFLAYGGEWSNSDYGNGTHSFRAFALRVVCLNGMTRENLLKQVHLGGKLSDDIEFSDRTYRLDTAASVSALQDVVRGALGPKVRNSLTESIRAAAGADYGKGQLAALVAKVGTKDQVKAVVGAFESEDVINLPAGKTAWRASNAISWVARHTEDAERRLDLERLAGSVV